jgi:hypothetical protein
MYENFFCQYIGYDPATHDMWDEHPFALSREAAQWEMVQRRQGMPRYFPLPGTEREKERERERERDYWERYSTMGGPVCAHAHAHACMRAWRAT